MANARLLAVQLLDKTFQKNGFSNIVLDSALKDSQLSVQDKKFCTAVYYGVLERKITLDHIISQYCRQMKKLDSMVVNILRAGIYQILYMDSVPDNSAVDESVKLTRKTGRSRFSGLVNAVLRNFIRDGRKIKFPQDSCEMMSVKYSAPVWLVRKFINEYGSDFAKAMLEASVMKPPVNIRLNNLCADEKTLLENSGGFEFVKKDFMENNYELKGSGDVTTIPAFEKGMFHVQDSASQLCCMALNPQKNDIVIDICSAPGGKSFTMAEMMENTGCIYAFDLHEKRVGLIRNGAKRLGISNIKAQTGDAAVFNDKIPPADKILCDVPCSGLGVIRRKPEIKYKNPDDFKNLPEIQYKILENASKYLKKGGELVYSTCTLNKSENEGVIKKFLQNHPEFKGVSFLTELGEPFSDFTVTLSPQYFYCDGFFISKIMRIK